MAARVKEEEARKAALVQQIRTARSKLPVAAPTKQIGTRALLIFSPPSPFRLPRQVAGGGGEGARVAAKIVSSRGVVPLSSGCVPLLSS